MTAQLTRTLVRGHDVILTEGMIDGATGHRIYGAFASEDDARSMEADKLSLGMFGADDLTADQLRIARENSAAL